MERTVAQAYQMKIKYKYQRHHVLDALSKILIELQLLEATITHIHPLNRDRIEDAAKQARDLMKATSQAYTDLCEKTEEFYENQKRKLRKARK